MMPNLADMSLWIAVPVFVAAAIVVWFSGARITKYADIISEQTGIGQAVLGVLMLGGITSLPEVAVALSSSISGDGDLAVNSVLGGVAMQVAVLAFADAIIGRRALTSIVPNSIVMVQAGLKILLLSIVAAAIMVGDHPLLGAGVWMWLLLVATGLSLLILARSQGRHAWVINPDTDDGLIPDSDKERREKQEGDRPLKAAIFGAVIAGTIIVISGYVLSRSADVIAESTGLGQSFVGAVFLAISTSLPEVSTVFSAMRAGLYTLAISDIFGTNLFDIGLLFFVDITGGSDAVINQVGAFSGFATLLGIVVTTIFLIGIAERNDKTVFRMGYDSAAVLAAYLSGLFVLYFLR